MEFARGLLRCLASIWIVAWFSLRRRATTQDYRRLDRQAQRVVDESLRDNVWRRSATPSRAAQFLLWGGKYPLRFAAVIGVVCAAIGVTFLPAPLPQLAVIPLPTLPSEYNHPGFFGTVWSVQATLVALVYPFVVTFIAVMLQRRAASKIALSVYLLDSAVLPAGTSSLLLLAAMAIQYFLLVAAPSDLFLAAAVFNGVWFLANTALTGYFLAKTIRYVEDEVGQRAYRNLAVSLVLRDELTASLSKHLLVNAAERLNWQATSNLANEPTPEVQLLSLSRGRGQVVRTFNREATLVDVHLGALEWVAKRWLARVPSSQKQSGMRAQRPVLQFRSMLHGTSIGPVELCSVADGPDLTPLEAEVVRRAFVFGKRPRNLVTGSTTDMLEELATEVHSLMEQARNTAGRQAFHRMTDLHVGLLEACHEAAEVEGDVSSAAGLATSPYSWGGRNLNTTWLRPYRELVFSAVSQLERDQTLLSSLAYAASNVIAGSELQPPQLVAELFSLPKLLDHALASWWLKEAQRAGAKPDPEGYVLPLPAVEDYRKAIVTLVGGISSFRYAHSDGPTKPAIAWKRRCRAARAWAAHVDLSATLLLNAVARGDGVAAEWYCDNIAAWWGNHQYELDYGHHVDYEPGLSEVRLGITELDWQSAEQKFAGLAKRPVDIDEAHKVVWHTVRRYWESMRMVVCLLLLQQAEAGKFQVLATRIAANLARHQLSHAGPRSEGLDLSDADELLALFVETCFTDSWVERRLDAFCEERGRWSDSAPVVSGWMYSGSGGATDIRSKVVALSQLLLAAQPGARETWRKTDEVLGRADMDLLTLGQVAYLANSSITSSRQKSFRPFLPVTASLRSVLGKGALMSSERKRVFRGYVGLRRGALARREAGLLALSVSQHVVDDLAQRLSAAMATTGALSGSRAFCKVRIGAAPGALSLNATGFKFTKENLTEPPLVAISDGEVEHLAKDFMNHTVAYSLSQMLATRAVLPIPHPDDAALLTNIEEAAERLRLIGLSPVAVVSPASTAIQALRPYQWGRPGRPLLPTGIQLSYHKSGVYEFADGFVNDTPVISSGTPSRATFVVPLEWMATLVLEPKPLGVVGASHAVTGANEVTVNFVWDASLQSS
jgi:hypothetical protein